MSFISLVNYSRQVSEKAAAYPRAKSAELLSIEAFSTKAAAPLGARHFAAIAYSPCRNS